MAHRLKTPEGKELFALRKHTPEPVFGIIKSTLRFRQLLLRGLDTRAVALAIDLAGNSHAIAVSGSSYRTSHDARQPSASR
jgi:hypothetical protein